MNKQDIIKALNELNLDKSRYWLNAGSAMIFYGLRETTNDIDMGCTSSLADELENKFPTKRIKDGTRRLELRNDIEMYESWIEDKVVMIEGFPIISIEGLLKIKQRLNREKDQLDIVKIKEYINNKKKD